MGRQGPSLGAGRGSSDRGANRGRGERVIDDEHPLAAERALHGERIVVRPVVIHVGGPADKQRCVTAR